MSSLGPLPPLPPTQDWVAPSRFVESIPLPVAGAFPAMYDLRPLTTSEVLDRTFSIYRSNFWMFAGIASFSGALQSVVAVCQMVFQGRVMLQAQQAQHGGLPVSPFASVTPMIIMFFASMLHFLTWSIILAACIYALGEIYLGRSTSIVQAFGATIRRWYSYLGISLWQVGSFMWLPFVFMIAGGALAGLGFVPQLHPGGALAAVGFFLLIVGMTAGGIVGFVFYLRNSFGVPIAVLERSKVRPAMRRSKHLTDGTKWRILLVWLITIALFMVVGILQAPLTLVSMMLIMKGGHAFVTQTISLIVNFVGYTVVTPVPMIGLSLLYFDQRVRKEAFDIAFLLSEERALEPVITTPAAPGPAVDAPQY